MMDPLSPLSSLAPRVEPSAPPAFLNAVELTPGVSSPNDFSNMISQMITETAAALHKAESTSIAGVQGEASIQKVVETVMQAEQMLQAAIAIRDKVTAAYLELSRMAI